jgi:hypothetical protein
LSYHRGTERKEKRRGKRGSESDTLSVLSGVSDSNCTTEGIEEIKFREITTL